MDNTVRKELDNGLTVLFQPVSHAVSVSIGLYVRAGSRFENELEAGYTHFLEHMLFKGTKSRSAKQISVEVERVGGNINAYTSREYTCYYITLIKDELALGLDILSDMVFNSVLRQEDIENESKVIIEELISYEDSPDDFVYDFYYRNIFSGASLGKDIIGNRESIQSVTSESLGKYFHQHYSPQDMILSVCGGVEQGLLFGLVEKYFSPIPGKQSVTKKFETVKKDFSKHLEYRDLGQVIFLLGAEGYKRDMDLSIQQNLALSIFGGGMSSRLFQKIREEKALCYSINSYPSAYRDTGISTISCSTSKENLNSCIEEIIQEIREVKTNGFNKEEVDNIKTNMAGTIAIGFELPEHRMNTMAVQEIYFGRYYSFAERIHKIKQVTLDELNEMFRNIYSIPTLHFSGIGAVDKIQVSNIRNEL